MRYSKGFAFSVIVTLLAGMSVSVNASSLTDIARENAVRAAAAFKNGDTVESEVAVVEDVLTTESEPEISDVSLDGVFGIGDVWTVDGQWKLVITGVEETEERNQYSDKNPGAVYVVTYQYKNLGYEDKYQDGLYISLDDMIVDSAGKMGYTYPGDVTYYPQNTPVGAFCEAQVCIGVDNPGDFQLRAEEYDGNGNEQEATFSVSLDAEPITGDAIVDDRMPDAAMIKMGETWTVDGQWKLTVNSVTETSDRNSYEERNPAAVYIVDYTYENLGYEDDYMDGLFMSLDDASIDNAGKMGYSYPGNVSKYPTETPVGASCDAQACIGVDHAGDFTIFVREYDGNNETQMATFEVKVS